jgi:hypothetical protein
LRPASGGPQPVAVGGVGTPAAAVTARPRFTG